MNISGIVGTVIGIIFVFLVFSLVVSGVNEAITRVLAWRSRHLWRTLRQLMDGAGKKLTEDQRPKPREVASVDIADPTKPGRSGSTRTPSSRSWREESRRTDRDCPESHPMTSRERLWTFSCRAGMAKRQQLKCARR